METVEVLIKIPKDVYEKIQQVDRIISGRRNGKTIEFALWNGVKNGIPLTKGHGKLIAEPTEEDIAKTVGGQNDFADCIREAVKTVFANAPTIIDRK